MTKWLIFNHATDNFEVAEVEDPDKWIEDNSDNEDAKELLVSLDTALEVIEPYIKSIVVYWENQYDIKRGHIKYTKGTNILEGEITAFILESE